MDQPSASNSTTGTKTETVDETDAKKLTESQSAPVLILRLEQRDDRRVGFHDGVVDNEHMNRKKSKCCCIYKKPLAFGESSSEDDEDCEHCFGHPEKRKKNRRAPSNHEPVGDSCPSNEPESCNVSNVKPTSTNELEKPTTSKKPTPPIEKDTK